MKSITLLLPLTLLTTALTPHQQQQQSQQPQNLSLPLPLLPSLTTPPRATSTCYVPGGNIRAQALLSDCYTAIRLVLAERSILIPQRFTPRPPPSSPNPNPNPNIMHVPFYKKYNTCMFVLDTADPTQEQEFLLIRAAYLAAELVQPCVARQKTPLGGRTLINIGGFFVAVIGSGEGTGEEDGIGAVLGGLREGGGNGTRAIMRELRGGV